MTVLTWAQAVVKSQLNHGVDTLFGIPGAHRYDFSTAIYEEPGNFSCAINCYADESPTLYRAKINT